MSLLTACQGAVKETGLGSVPSTIISNTDASAIQLNGLAEAAVRWITRKNWQAMLREHTLSTVASTEDYALPSDWARYAMQTAWDATNYWQMRGSIGGPVWQAEKRGIVTNANVRKDFRVWQNRLYIMPTPSSVASLVIEYIRNTPWVNGSTYRTAAAQDNDTVVFPAHLLDLELVWRWRRAKGVDYAEEKAESERQIDIAFAQDTPARVLNMGQRSEGTPPFLANIPQQIS